MSEPGEPYELYELKELFETGETDEHLLACEGRILNPSGPTKKARRHQRRYKFRHEIS